ncbi:MAG: four helix bundle protein [Thermoanaerobaculia bacterium]|nr:four helix bundle protein [Thermoanaerobaculia bacterium]
MGGQFCEAADSIASNIAEGHGWYHFKENKNFCFYARGSLLESKSWLKKSHNRNLVDDATFTRISNLLAQ